MRRRIMLGTGAAAAAGLAWGHFEAGWVRLAELDCALPRLPDELAGLRVAHLSDFHLGMPSRGAHAVERAIEWVIERRPDLTLVSGDLLSRQSGEARLRELIGVIPNCFAVLGNHDFGRSRDPFADSRPVFDLGDVPLLLDEGRTVELRGRRVQIVGVDLVLAGHLHAGQITLPIPGRRIPLAHPRWHYFHGLYERNGTAMHVSAGLGTTFVPFRFLARPEATELRLLQS
jgi:uncharacterized protein